MINFFIYKKITSSSSNEGRLEDISVVWNFRTTAKIAIYSAVPNGCVENSGFPNFMEVAR